MKILLNFDKAVAEVLADKVKSRLQFKVGLLSCITSELALNRYACRATWTRTGSAMKYGPLLSKT
jgi:hypothetical protein